MVAHEVNLKFFQASNLDPLSIIKYEHPFIVTIQIVTMKFLHCYHTNGNYEHPYIVTINGNHDHGLVDVSDSFLSRIVITLIQYFQTVIQAKPHIK